MNVLKFKMPFQSSPSLVISPEEIIKHYLFGIPICNADGREMTNDFIKEKILNTQEYIENLLYIKLTEQIIYETSDFNRTEWSNWGFVKTSYPVNFALQLDGRYNSVTQISYPSSWLSHRKESNTANGPNDGVFNRQIHLVPSGTSGEVKNNGTTYIGTTPHSLIMGIDNIPNFWNIFYVSGFKEVPRELIDVIGKLAAIQMLVQLGDVYMGVGTSNYSIGLDGLSQSISLLKTNDSGVYGSRIKGFGNDLFGPDGKGGMMETLKAKYKGILWDVL